MKKEEKQKHVTETAILGEIQLTNEQLDVVRLLAPVAAVHRKCRMAHDRHTGEATYIFSKRTIEAVLHGRRRNSRILKEALDMAREKLRQVNSAMDEIETAIKKH